jgi:NTP pyrophosphatase (non-canonical NTP hydrolase)
VTTAAAITEMIQAIGEVEKATGHNMDGLRATFAAFAFKMGDEAVAMAQRPLCTLADEAREINRPKDWDNVEHMMATLMLITTEVAEAAEEVRKGDKYAFGVELADVVIRTIGLARGMGLNVDVLVKNKLDKNKERGHRHGGKRI